MAEAEVVGCHLSRDGQPAGLGASHQPHAARGAHVGDMHVGTRELSQGDVAGHDRLLGSGGEAAQAQAGRHPALVHHPARERQGLAVVDDGQATPVGAEHGGVLQGPPHQMSVGHRRTVIAEGDGARRGQLIQLSQFLALPRLGDAADGQDAYSTLRLRRAQDELDGGCGVGGGLRVGHGADGGESAAGRRQGTGGDGLLVLEAGLPQVGVDIDEAGADHQPRRVDVLRGAFPRARPHRLHTPVDDEHVGYGVQAVGRVDDAAAADGNGFAHGFPLASR